MNPVSSQVMAVLDTCSSVLKTGSAATTIVCAVATASAAVTSAAVRYRFIGSPLVDLGDPNIIYDQWSLM